MKRKFYITILVDNGEVVSGSYEGETLEIAIEQAREQAGVLHPGRHLFTTGASLDDFGGLLRWMRRSHPMEVAAA